MAKGQDIEEQNEDLIAEAFDRDEAYEADAEGENFNVKDFAGALFHYLKPKAVAREASRFLGEAKNILVGESELTFDGDGRFADPSWESNAIYKRLGLSYLALCRSLEALINDEDSDPMRQEKARLALEHITSVMAPTNHLLGNPAAMKHLYESGGSSFFRGVRNLISDLQHNNGLPAQVDVKGFVLGENLACSKGAVVFRNEQLEILQYAPTTTQVYEIPVLVMTPQVNKFYFLDLAPGRSFVEYMTAKGYQVFIVSWRNPGPEEGHWCLDDYCQALNEAIDAVRDVSGADKVNTFGFCAGGITMSALLSYLNQTGQADKINVVSYAVTLMDFSQPAMIGVLKADFLLSSARKGSQNKGVLEGDKLAAVFTMLRPKDLIWNNWVNNYLMGKSAPAFDILAWNDDNTNLPSGLHEDFLTIFDNNVLTKKGAFEVLGTPLDVGKINYDAFVVGTIRDHLTPWVGCYQTTQLLGGQSEFVLSSAGHIAGLVNPPGNPKSFYLTGPAPGPDAEAWQEQAERHQGSWWEYWAEWASTRSGKKRRARKRLGSAKYPALEDAPGSYVFD